MAFIEISGCIVAILCLWVMPIVLGIKVAKKNHRSLHWMWFGVHPMTGWIALLVLYFAAPQKECPNCGEHSKPHAKVCPYCTVPFDQSAQIDRPRNVRAIVFVTIALILGMAGFFGFTFGLVNSSFKDSGAYQQAVHFASTDRRVIELLGSPVTGGAMASGSISTSGDATGSADLSIPINGPKGAARLYASGTLKAGIWSWQTLEVDPKNGQPRINLLDRK